MNNSHKSNFVKSVVINDIKKEENNNTLISTNNNQINTNNEHERTISTMNETKILKNNLITNQLLLIKSTEELYIDFTNQLKKRKTIITLKDKVYKCKALNPQLKDIDLILKKYDCIDKKTYDKKLFEIEFYQRFSRNKNIVSLYSYWSEEHTNP